MAHRVRRRDLDVGLGILLLMLIAPLLYEAWPRLGYLLHGIAYPLDLGWLFLFLVPSIVAALSGAAFIRAGYRIRTGKVQGGSIRRLAVYSPRSRLSGIRLIAASRAGGAGSAVLDGVASRLPARRDRGNALPGRRSDS